MTEQKVTNTQTPITAIAMNEPKTITTQPTNPITPIDTKSIIEHGNSPTAIILAIAILLAIVFQSLTGLIQVILRGRNNRVVK